MVEQKKGKPFKRVDHFQLSTAGKFKRQKQFNAGFNLAFQSESGQRIQQSGVKPPASSAPDPTEELTRDNIPETRIEETNVRDAHRITLQLKLQKPTRIRRYRAA